MTLGVNHLLSGTLSSDNDKGNENVTKQVLMSNKMVALHVRYTLWYISLLSSVKQHDSRFCGECELMLLIYYLILILSKTSASVKAGYVPVIDVLFIAINPFAE